MTAKPRTYKAQCARCRTTGTSRLSYRLDPNTYKLVDPVLLCAKCRERYGYVLDSGGRMSRL